MSLNMQLNRPCGYDMPRIAKEAMKAPKKAMAVPAAELAAKRKIAIEQNLREAGLPKRFYNSRVEAYHTGLKGQQVACGIVASYCQTIQDRIQGGDSLLFSGNPGTGKTHLACAIARAAIKAGYTARYISTYDLIRTVKETWRQGSTMSEREAIASFVSPDLLVLDEIGVQFGSNAEKVILFDVLNKRYADVLPTIAISNLQPKNIGEYLGERIVDRFCEGSGCTVPFTWTSYRRKGNEAVR